MPRRISVLIAIVVVVMVAGLGSKLLRNHRLAKEFGRIKEGDAVSSVLTRMGDPARIVEPLPSHGCDGVSVRAIYATANDRRCVKQLQYDLAFLPSCYSICVDGSGRVIDAEYRPLP